MTDTPVLDQTAIDNLRDLGAGDGGAFLREIIEIFLSDTPERIAELKESLGHGDRERFLRNAHSIKGSSSNVGARALRIAAEQIEIQAHEGLSPGLSTPLAELTAEFDRVRAELQRLL